jgi:hypothetical protein
MPKNNSIEKNLIDIWAPPTTSKITSMTNCDTHLTLWRRTSRMSQKSVQLSTIRQWEHQMYWWTDAYRVDMGTIYTQKQARIFGCMKYKLHRRNTAGSNSLRPAGRRMRTSRSEPNLLQDIFYKVPVQVNNRERREGRTRTGNPLCVRRGREGAIYVTYLVKLRGRGREGARNP